ncbi:hypothetical protein AXG93_4548s1070 [Marchantia polymorpha subsp. ruderalis]|uniref:Uncharacterized protein n=1 Tax=Marchantia polymorpha subsp. ruderalis TaxID=1480154 RepID=A0A176W8L4_MARPO|nr:hypothetical protein AXG93_4548s1070 [Marchantia polymorpha subsp. ruderalis]
MGLLTKSKEKRFLKEVLIVKSREDTEEEDNVQAEEPPKRTAQGRCGTFGSIDGDPNGGRRRTFEGEEGDGKSKSSTFGANAIYGEERSTSAEDE